MKYEVCEMLATHLKGGRGVNVLRQSVPLHSNDPPLEPVTVRSEFEVAWISGEPLPVTAYEDGPLCLVRGGEDVAQYSSAGNPEILNDDGRLTLGVFLFFPRREQRNMPSENRMLSALLRVVRRSVGIYFEDVPVTDRNLRDVQITALLAPIRLVPMIAAVSEVDLLAGVIVCDCKVLDRWAEGIVA